MIEKLKDWWKNWEWPFMRKSTHYTKVGFLHKKIHDLENKLVAERARTGCHIL